MNGEAIGNLGFEDAGADPSRLNDIFASVPYIKLGFSMRSAYRDALRYSNSPSTFLELEVLRERYPALGAYRQCVIDQLEHEAGSKKAAEDAVTGLNVSIFTLVRTSSPALQSALGAMHESVMLTAWRPVMDMVDNPQIARDEKATIETQYPSLDAFSHSMLSYAYKFAQPGVNPLRHKDFVRGGYIGIFGLTSYMRAQQIYDDFPDLHVG